MSDFLITSMKRLVPASPWSIDHQGETHIVEDAREGLIFVDVTAKSGTNSPTLHLLVEASWDGNAWYVLTELDEITDVSTFVYPITNFGKYIRIRWVITGTDPSFTFQVHFVGKR